MSTQPFEAFSTKNVNESSIALTNANESLATNQTYFLPTSNSETSNACNAEEAEITRIVQKTLLELQDISRPMDTDTVVSMVVPKVLFDLHAYDQMHDELQTMKESMSSYIQHSKVLGEDIAEIFLDLHNIYTRLEAVEDKGSGKKPRAKHFEKRLRDAENFLDNTKHYIVNDSAISNDYHKQDIDISHEGHKQAGIVSVDKRNAERRTFLSNMVTVKKSDFSLGMNRNKSYFMEAKRVLEKGESSTKKY